ncbi:MAG: hypothetical protein AB2793_12670 [Candidatus Thiodiazotropha sp.]
MYTLQAIIAKTGTLSIPSTLNVKIVPLQQGYEMLPFTNSFLEDSNIPFLPLTDEGQEILPNSIKSLCEVLSKQNQLAYVEAELFGGAGTQASVVFSNGRLEVAPKICQSAINQAMAALGVTKAEKPDEFEAIGLNEHRDTNKWVE